MRPLIITFLSILLLGILLDGTSGVQLCPNGWIQSIIQGKCFRIVRRKTSPADGSLLCREFGGSAASIESEVEQDFIQKNIMSETDDWLHIGGRRNENTKYWYWEDGTPMRYTYFNGDEGGLEDMERIYLYMYSHKNHAGTEVWGKWHASTGGAYDTLCQLRLPRT